MEEREKIQEQKAFMECRDFLVSGEKFRLVPVGDLEILKTDPVPENLNVYYESKNYISHTDSSKGITAKVYQLIKKYMLKKKLQWIEHFKTSGKILDLGAGTGDFLIHCKRNGWETYGVEPNSSARDLAFEKGIDLKKDLAEFPGNFFDAISMWHVLEHIPELESQIKKIHTLLKKDGLLVIAIPNFKSYDAKYYKEYWAAYDVPRHLWHFSQNGLNYLMKNLGWRLKDVKPLPFDAYYVSLLSEKNKPGSGSFFNAIYRGLISNFKAKSTSEYSSMVYFFRKG